MSWPLSFKFEKTMPSIRLLLQPICMLALFVLSMSSASINAAEPAIRNLDLRGLRIGGTTTLVIDGDDLGNLAALAACLSPRKQTLKPGGTDKQAVFEVTLPADVRTGLLPPARGHRRAASACRS